MTAADHREIILTARGWATGITPRPVHSAWVRQVQGGVGIYLPCGPDTRVRYVGSAVRPHDPRGIASRILEHPFQKRVGWGHIWVVHLWQDTPAAVARAIEGQLIDRFDPRDNRKRHAPEIVPLRRVALSA